MPALKVDIEGVHELDFKISQFINFIGKDWNKTTLKVGKFGVNTFKAHILRGEAMGNMHWGNPTKMRFAPNVLSLQEDYAEEKLKAVGFTHPILIRSRKMFNDIKFKINTSWKHFASGNRIRLSWGFKTKRSQIIAKAHFDGIKRTKNPTPVIRVPFFFTIQENKFINFLYRQATIKALRKARLKSTKGI